MARSVDLAAARYNKDMNDCIFCKIAHKELGELIWENDVAAAFHDHSPKAPVHVLVVPKLHITNLDDLEDEVLAGKLVMAVRAVATQVGVKNAWRLRVNNGAKVGQSVPHLHFHVLGGEQMAE